MNKLGKSIASASVPVKLNFHTWIILVPWLFTAVNRIFWCVVYCMGTKYGCATHAYSFDQEGSTPVNFSHSFTH